ncbi:MAG: hypothetical protein ACREP8_04460, partial [Candidatus Binatia bacterium]
MKQDYAADATVAQAGQDLAEAKPALPIKSTFGYAQALRAIGDALESLHVETFEVESKDSSYLVRAE